MSVVTPTQFRFSEETLAEIDTIAAHLSQLTGAPSTRAAAIRYAVRQTVAEIQPEKKSEKKPKKSAT